MTILAKGNTICMLTNIEKGKRHGLKNVFVDKERNKVYGEPISQRFITSRNIVGRIMKIDDKNCTIQLGDYKVGEGFIPRKEEVIYSIDYLKGLEGFRYIKLLI